MLEYKLFLVFYTPFIKRESFYPFIKRAFCYGSFIAVIILTRALVIGVIFNMENVSQYSVGSSLLMQYAKYIYIYIYIYIYTFKFVVFFQGILCYAYTPHL